ncbi:unnamed protein product [Spirodela intermedia]|uniref:Uncharacterized protein n=1 Tax=Spirodela intermedia TaxID=51605 RepID=A0A7I8IL98_SPIIN|nr:unnamed protein product [Spirodela intermedia]CAA6658644.1 unnamed protein product [Spirodela intermedia]
MASWRSWTISSSTSWYRRSSGSKTSEAHSSLTTDCTQRGRSTASSLSSACAGALPVRSSRRRTPKL